MSIPYTERWQKGFPLCRKMGSLEAFSDAQGSVVRHCWMWFRKDNFEKVSKGYLMKVPLYNDENVHF